MPVLLLTCCGFEERKWYEEKISKPTTVGQMLVITCRGTEVSIFLIVEYYCFKMTVICENNITSLILFIQMVDRE